MSGLQRTFLISVGAGLTTTGITSGTSALLDVSFGWQLVLGIIAVALIVGLTVFGVLGWRRQQRLQRDLNRLERASWPGWMRDIAAAASVAGINVYREDDYVIFESSGGDRHLLCVDQQVRGLGKVLERERALKALDAWGVPIWHNGRGQPVPAISAGRLSP
jgi:hypothetical protein